MTCPDTGPQGVNSYDQEIDDAYEHTREHDDLTQLLETVRRWWYEAAWRDLQAQRQYPARVDGYLTDPGGRMTHQEVPRPTRRLTGVPVGTGLTRRAATRCPQASHPRDPGRLHRRGRDAQRLAGPAPEPR